MREDVCRSWSPIPLTLDASRVTLEVVRLEATTHPAPPSGQSVLTLELLARDPAEGGIVVGAWLLTFVYIMAYRMRPLDQPGNPSLTAPNDWAMFWEQFPSRYLEECSAPNGKYGGARWHHYVVRTPLGEAYEVVARRWECTTIPYHDG